MSAVFVVLSEAELSSERWAPIVGFEGFYEVSSLGRVRSLPVGRHLGKIRSQDLDPDGYPQLHITGNGKRLTVKVHQQVLRAFVGDCPRGCQACHGDGNRANARLANLRWDTLSANMDDQKRHGTFVVGSRNGNSKYTRTDLDRVKELRRQGRTVKQIRLVTGISLSHVKRIIDGETWVMKPPRERIKHADRALAECVAK